MKSKHSYVVLIDLPESLPFTIKKDFTKPDELKDVRIESEKSEKELLRFVEKLEKNFKEEISFIGEDIIAEKMYKRFLFTKSGFMEIMYQAPVSIIAHFIEKKRAQDFSLALRKTLKQTVKDKKVLPMLDSMVEVNTEKDEALNYSKWSKLKDIRTMSEG